MAKERKKLSDIVSSDTTADFRSAWKSTEAAADNVPIPRGTYVCRVLGGELDTSKTKGTPSYKLKFEVCEGEHSGRQVWHDCWLTAAALPMSKRDLAKIGISTPEQMEQPLPAGIVCKVVVVVHSDDDDIPHNKVKQFEFLRTEEPPENPFPAVPPSPSAPDAGADPKAPPPSEEIPI